MSGVTPVSPPVWGSAAHGKRPAYAELDVTTNFSFLHGASHPAELVTTAAALGLSAIAITDRNSLAGVVRAWEAAKDVGIRVVVGCRLDLMDCASVLVYPVDRAAYGRLCSLLTVGRRRARKGECTLYRADLEAHAEGMIAAVIPPDSELTPSFINEVNVLSDIFENRCHLVARCRLDGRDARRLNALDTAAREAGVPLLATNGVRMHTPARAATAGCADLHPRSCHGGNRRLALGRQRRSSPEGARGHGGAVRGLPRRHCPIGGDCRGLHLRPVGAAL